MRKLLLLSIVILSGCTSLQPDGTRTQTELGKAGQTIQAWWNRPDTQAKVQQIEQTLFVLGVNTVSAVAQSYGQTGSVNWYTVGTQAGISTLYQQSAALRQIQGTAQVLDPVAIAQVLQTNGTSQEMAQKLALQIAASTAALVANGMTPNQASESAAAQFEKAAADLTGVVK